MTGSGVVGGRYRLHEQIGSGGMGTVWRATDEMLGRQVAIKRIRLDLLDGDTAEITRRRTFREVRIAAQLHHPQVVSIFDIPTVDGDPWLVLEYLPSESLADTLATHGAQRVEVLQVLYTDRDTPRRAVPGGDGRREHDDREVAAASMTPASTGPQRRATTPGDAWCPGRAARPPARRGSR